MVTQNFGNYRVATEILQLYLFQLCRFDLKYDFSTSLSH